MSAEPVTEEIALKFSVANRHEVTLSHHLEVDVCIPAQGVTAIYGPSGSGKTTLLRCIAGLTPTKGHCHIGAEIWQDDSQNLACHQRALGYVFQESSLLPHLSAGKNLQYAASRASKPLSQAEQNKLIDMLELAPLLSRLPAHLSGGERQRVAIAKALVHNPKILLMDEPLASVDVALKTQVLAYLEQLKQQLKLPILYVTHAMEEITRLADYVVVLEKGKVVTHGTVTEVFNSGLQTPDKPPGAVIKATVGHRDTHWQLMRLDFDNTYLWLPDSGAEQGCQQTLYIQAQDVTLSLEKAEKSSVLNQLEGRVSKISPSPSDATNLVHLDIGSHTLVSCVTRRSIETLALHPGQVVWAQIKTAALTR